MSSTRVQGFVEAVIKKRMVFYKNIELARFIYNLYIPREFIFYYLNYIILIYELIEPPHLFK